MKTTKGRVGSSFDDFLTEENLLEEADAVAIKRVVAYQIKDAMKKKQLSKSALATKMKTSRSSVERLFDPESRSVTLLTLHKAAAALGKKIEVQLV